MKTETTQTNEWHLFVDKCSKLDFAKDEIIDLSVVPLERDGEDKYDVEINLDDIIGSDAKKGFLWIDLLKTFNRAEIDHNKDIHKIALEEYENLSQTNYLLIEYKNKYYISDGHNRIVFLKFYAELYNKPKFITVKRVYCPFTPDEKPSSFISKVKSCANSFIN
ncbi:MAG: hypothetical protein HRT42_13830 [Campylobacteraceae bacterium]|nr:hypothetical protein [Campylobacteraceae bacterium]